MGRYGVMDIMDMDNWEQETQHTKYYQHIQE